MNQASACTPNDADARRIENPDKNENRGKYKCILTPGLTPIPHINPDTPGFKTTPGLAFTTSTINSKKISLGISEPTRTGVRFTSTPLNNDGKALGFLPAISEEFADQHFESNSARFGFSAERTENDEFESRKTPWHFLNKTMFFGDESSAVLLGNPEERTLGTGFSTKDNTPGVKFGNPGENISGWGTLFDTAKNRPDTENLSFGPFDFLGKLNLY